MIAKRVTLTRCRLAFLVLGVATALENSRAQSVGDSKGAELLSKENQVDAARPSTAWTPAVVGQAFAIHDRLRTGEDSRAAVRLSDASILRIDELTETEILPPQTSEAKPTLNVKQGAAYFFSRERAREVQIQTPAANGAIRGTEFTVRVAANGNTSFTMLDGEVEVSNPQGSVFLRSGEGATVVPGGKPTKTAVISAINEVQWCLYYPGVLDLNDLAFSRDEESALAASLARYREGDLLRALIAYPRGRRGGSQAEKIYRAGLYLVVGQISKAEQLLRAVNAEAPGRQALATLIAAVTLQSKEDTEPRTPSDWLAESYYRQSKADLPAALDAAQRANSADPSFGFAWTRLAGLEFSFGRIPEAQMALEKGLTLTPRNPAAHALRGFLLSAENRIREAETAFEEAMAIDGALGDAWLGRGLCRIRRGQDDEGRRDLQVAAALEPNRAIFHSYLGKAFSNVGNAEKAYKELDRAKELDPRDPTAWLYSAIENRQNNRINQAVRDLETSLELNQNRRVYRSQFLLDQDRAVRSANLAAIYQDNGMYEVSVREATRGVDADYSNASAHLFLANSYNSLRDPTRINLRFETPWFNELLLANLLSPVGGGPLSQFVSEQEYSKLFEADGFGISSDATYLSYGGVREIASQYGTFGNFSYSLDLDFQYDPGQRPNNEITRSEAYAQVKYQITPRDTIFLQTKYQDVRQGDLLQRYNQADFEPGASFRELQQPAIVLAGYHHEWTPGVHTLLLIGRLADEVFFANLNSDASIAAFDQTGTRPNVSRSLVLLHNNAGEIIARDPFPLFEPLDLHYHNSFTTYTGELNQIWEQGNNTLIFGARFQSGEFHTSDRLDHAVVPVPPFFFNSPAAAQDFTTSLERQSVYIYDIWRPFRVLSLTAGLSYDRLEFPTNYRNAPIHSGEDSRARLSPKAGVIWNPCGNLFVRAAYTQSLGGVSFDQSVGLEPNQVAGFNQVFRSIISESVVGSVAAPTYDTAGILIEDRFPTGTYVGVQANLLQSDVDRTIGTFDAFLTPPPPPFFLDPSIVPSSTRQKLRYEEQDLLVTVNQLVGDEWSFGARYQLSYSNLQTIFPEIPTEIAAGADHREKATLHQGGIFALYNHPSGFFARIEGYWARQSNVGYSPDIPGDDILQTNAYLGYRFPRNFGDVTLGFLNMTDRDYKLNPLNSYNELSRDRTLVARVRLNF